LSEIAFESYADESFLYAVFSERGLALRVKILMNHFTPVDPHSGSYDVPSFKRYNLRLGVSESR